MTFNEFHSQLKFSFMSAVNNLALIDNNICELRSFYIRNFLKINFKV